jgi:serine/threonine protein kinase
MLAITPGTSINNRYEIQKVLGQGSFGRTYLAYDTQRFGDLCVLKEFLPANRAEYVIQKSRELFEREARVLYQINHPQIPKFLAWFTEQDRLFLVQQYINGQTYSHLLHERISQQGQAFSETEVIQWLKDLLSVLDYLHGIKIIHRDISPENVMFSHDQSKPVLIDFGLVKETITQLWSVDPNSPQEYTQASIIGKYGYAPPEQIRLGQCYPSSDLYALAVCAVVLLTGKNPKLLMDQSLEWQWHSYVDISEDLAQILDKMLAEKPRQRYQSAQEILTQLELVNLSKQEFLSLPRKKLQINIDRTRKEREVAEILESDDFKILEQQANKFRQTNPISADSQEKEDVFWQSTTASELISNQTFEPVIVAPEAQPPLIPLNPEFLEHCQQELSRCIGPMAHSLLEDTLAQFPRITHEQLVEALAVEIPNIQRAQAFRNSIKIPSAQPDLKEPQKEIANQATPINPKFLEHCQQELTRSIGPMASFLLEDTLAEFPQMTPEQLVEALAAEIPNTQRAQEFRNRIKI